MTTKQIIKSPLRFPGSKSKVLKHIRPYLSTAHTQYREPFFGGGSIFFGKSLSETNWINDKDYRVYNFFKVVKENPGQLCDIIRNVQPNIDLWKNFRLNSVIDDKITQAFQFLFFNRTNYSGIYHANPIGGLKQSSKYKIDCRWNPNSLCDRITRCSKKLQTVKITNLDFESLIVTPGENVFLVIDPPYYLKGNSLYPVGMQHEEHVQLANLLRETPHKFLLTIDDNEFTREIYHSNDFIYNQETWFYTIHSKKKDNKGKELFISNFHLH